VLLAPWSSQNDVLPLLLGSWRPGAATLVPLVAAAGWTLLDYAVAVVAMRRLDV
jgi:hypothetical protein